MVITNHYITLDQTGGPHRKNMEQSVSFSGLSQVDSSSDNTPKGEPGVYVESC